MSIIFDHKAIGEKLRLASGLKTTPPQNEVKPVEQPVAIQEVQSHIYDYTDGSFPSDFSCFGHGNWHFDGKITVR